MVPVCDNNMIISEGAIEKLNEVLSFYKKPLIVTDVVIYDKYRGLIESLVDADVVWAISPDFQKGMVSQYPKVDIIVGFGGGKSIDLAKILSIEAGLEWISVPTAASHDGIASDVASVMQNGYRYSKKCKKPNLILADLEIISTAPKILTLSGIGDIICKTSSLAEWKLAHEVANETFDQGVYDCVRNALDVILKDTSLETLVRAIIETGNAMADFGSSRPCSGTEHAISHAMDRRVPSLHGLQVAFATPLVLHFLEKTEYGNHSPMKIREFLVGHRMPVELKELDMTKAMFLDDIHHALKIMEKRGRYSILKHIDASDEALLDAIDILKY